jgi:hypothetical protein
MKKNASNKNTLAVPGGSKGNSNSKGKSSKTVKKKKTGQDGKETLN